MAMLRLLKIAIFLSTFSAFVEAESHVMNSRKLEDQTPPDLDNKCGNCPCDKPCNPPSIPPPSPPPPSPPPPPPKNPPTSSNCPPPPSPPTSVPSGQKPPSSPYIYINGPPGSVYPVYPYYSSAERTFSMGVIPFLIGILWVLAFSIFIL